MHLKLRLTIVERGLDLMNQCSIYGELRGGGRTTQNPRHCRRDSMSYNHAYLISKKGSGIAIDLSCVYHKQDDVALPVPNHIV